MLILKLEFGGMVARVFKSGKKYTNDVEIGEVYDTLQTCYNGTKKELARRLEVLSENNII